MKEKTKRWLPIDRQTPYRLWIQLRARQWLRVLASCGAALILFFALSPRRHNNKLESLPTAQQRRADAERAQFLETQVVALASSHPQAAADALRRGALSIYYAGNATVDQQPAEAYLAGRHLLDSIIIGKASVACPADPTLPVGTWTGGSVLFAADLHNNEHILPHFIYQLVQAIAQLPTGRAFVSVYESGSDDNTLIWLQLLKSLLDILGTPYRIVVSGKEVRQPEQDRIGFLAQVRNQALQPLWAHDEAQRFNADRVVFLNDVFYCAKDIKRLLLHGANIACGMDFDVPDLLGIPASNLTDVLVEHLKSRYMLPLWIAKALATSDAVRESFAHHQPNIDAFQRRAPLGFYDIWVAHDAAGHAFDKYAPYIHHLYSQQRLRQGLPVPVNCCWNGLVVLDAEPFKRGLRFRMHEPGECAASECSLMCDDFRRLGYGRAVLDPSVRTAYQLRFAEQVYNPDRVHQLAATQWADVEEAPAIDLSTVSETPHQWCCYLEDGEDMVDFDKHCRVYAPFETNYTAAFFRSVQYRETLGAVLAGTKL